jgi:hypothetical protein
MILAAPDINSASQTARSQATARQSPPGTAWHIAEPSRSRVEQAACPDGERTECSPFHSLATGFGGHRVMAIFGAWYDFFFEWTFFAICGDVFLGSIR